MSEKHRFRTGKDLGPNPSPNTLNLTNKETEAQRYDPIDSSNWHSKQRFTLKPRSFNSREMEKEKPFKLFVPPRLSSSQVSAVKPQTIGGDSNFFKGFNKCIEDDFGLPFGITKPSKHGENIDTDPVLQKVNFLPRIEEVGTNHSNFLEELKNPQFETSEPISRVYSKLYKEAEKIKKWKVNIEFELNQNEKKLQENRKIIEAQRKAIQELQFENEKVSLKLEDGIQENKELLKENNATRHLCNLLKETCAWSAEKSKKYEYEREETRQLYAGLNNNLEKMVQAFEELRVGAESCRQEMHFKLKEAYEKIQQLEKEHVKEVRDKEHKVSLLLMQIDEKELKIKDLKLLLQEYNDKINQFQEKMKWQNENLKESKDQQDHLMSELEEIKMSLQKSEISQKTLEEELQAAGKMIILLTREKEAQMEEISEAKITHSSVVAEFEATISTLKELLTTEQHRLEKNEEQLKTLILELQKKSSELEEEKLCKKNKELQLEEESKRTLEVNQKLLKEKKHFEMITEKLQATEIELNETLQIKEKEVHDLKVKFNTAVENEQNYLEQVAELKTELEQERLKSFELTVNFNKISLENKQIAQERITTIQESKKLQKDINDNKKQEEKMMKQIENLEETKNLLRDELDAVKEELKQKNEEVESKLNESEENARSIENEILKKDKQIKILENKFNSLKKQMENKTKSFEELQQENKALKKKSIAENKQLNAYEIKINKLELELDDANKRFEEMTDNYQKEIANKNILEENLLKEVEKAKTIADEAVKLQKEIDLRCQHKITEMVALMEKHKDQYDKIVEERDSELGLYKNKEQEQSMKKTSLEIEVSSLKSKLSSLETQLKIETEEKEKLLREAKENKDLLKERKDKKIQTSVSATSETSKWKFDSKKDASQNASLSVKSVDCGKSKDKEEYFWTPAKKSLSISSLKAYTVKTPTKMKMLQSEKRNPVKEGTIKKRKMLFEFDTNSDSSEHTDLLSMVSDEEQFQTLYKNYPKPSHPCVATPKMDHRPSSIATPGSALKFAAMRKMREDGWAAVSRVDRKKKMKEAEKLFT
ncbi:synaptonemal complex protein 1 isoform X1 [Monodelphis domestica]|uniref:synaptonemal complex protein 1 isoform X1 n=2 Tax=Monodelphis domestica TaxID=13616 RepID=UPI0024E2480F|nr:synaptonemal complex protein 1 isoform X1 [Monodelphis domestica]